MRGSKKQNYFSKSYSAHVTACHKDNMLLFFISFKSTKQSGAHKIYRVLAQID